MARNKRKHEPITQSNPTSIAAEAYHTIHTNFQSLSNHHNHRVILITSANRSEGKTLTSCNLAVAAAQSQQKVLLIDGNLRNPELHSQFGLSNESGLSTVLTSNEMKTEYIQLPNLDTLFVLPSGPKTNNPAATLSGDSLSRFILHVRREFELVIIDGPQVLSVSDALLLSRAVDGVVFVVDAQKTNRTAAQRAITAIHQVNGNIVGGIVNRIPKHVKKYPVGMSITQGALPEIASR